MEKEIGCYHEFLAGAIKQRRENKNTPIIKRERVRKILYNYGIPSFLHEKFLKEMESMCLIKKINKQSIELIGK